MTDPTSPSDEKPSTANAPDEATDESSDEASDESSDDTEEAAEAAPSRPLWESIWQGSAMAEARQRLDEADEASGPDLQRAEAAHAFGMRALDPADPLPSGPAPYLASMLFREASFWALRAVQLEGDSLERLLSAAPPALLAFAAGGEEHVDAIRALLLSSSRADAERPVAEVERDARLLAPFAKALIDAAHGPKREVERLLFSRISRVSALALLVASLVGALVWGIFLLRTPPDLLRGKPWQASSTYKGFTPASHTVDGNYSEIFFHTNEETNPWVEFDLQSPRSIRTITVKNRTDCCSERALPLVVEVSDDRNRWTEVARRSEDFRTWTAQISPRTTRYLRLRSLKRTWLHLVSVNAR